MTEHTGLEYRWHHDCYASFLFLDQPDIPNRGEQHGAPGSRVATGGPGHVGGASVSLCEGAADCVRHYYGVCTITYPIFQLSGTTGRPAAIRWLARCYDPHRVRAMSRDNDHHEVNHMLVGLCVEVDGVLGTMLLLKFLRWSRDGAQRCSTRLPLRRMNLL